MQTGRPFHVVARVVLCIGMTSLATCAKPKYAADASLLLNASDPQVWITDSLTYYDVDGNSEIEVARQMQQFGPRTANVLNPGVGTTVALHNGRFSQKVNYRMVGLGCLADIRLDGTSTILLPRWRWVSRMPTKTQQAWQTFTMALRSHEDIHRQLFYKQLDSLWRAVRALGGPDCPTLRDKVASTTRAVNEYWNQQQWDYDQANKSTHEGGVWPPPP